MNLENIIRGVEIAELAKSRRKTQAFTAEEEPIVIQALLSSADVLARLLMEETTNGTSQVNNQTASGNC
jgi:hypothetical protein